MTYENTNPFATAADNVIAITASSEVVAPTAEQVVEKAVPLTKEQRIAKIDEQITKLKARKDAIVNGVVREPKAPAVEAPLPTVGDTVSFRFGRKTPTTHPVIRVGVVLAVRPAGEVDGKRTPAMLKVSCGEGFETEVHTIFAGSVLTQAEQEEAKEDAEQVAAEAV